LFIDGYGFVMGEGDYWLLLGIGDILDMLGVIGEGDVLFGEEGFG
jgi:hypothetical protein